MMEIKPAKDREDNESMAKPYLSNDYNTALQKAEKLVGIQKALGLKLTIWDKNLNRINAKFDSIADLLRNPSFIANLTQEFYVSNAEETMWFRMKIKKGEIVEFTFLLMFCLHWVKIYNKSNSGFDYILASYSPGDGNVGVATAVVPQSKFTPEKCWTCFPHLIGETANNMSEIGKLICYILSKYITNPSPEILEFVGEKQGFVKDAQGKIRFSPPHMLREELKSYLTPAITRRQYPICDSTQINEDMTLILAPLFTGQTKLQIPLLWRFSSWHSSFFARKDIYADDILIVKPTVEVPVPLAVALLKNTSYDSLDAPPIGPNIKPLKFDLENVNDGMVIAIDVFAADQVKKVEKGYDLMINDAAGATAKSNNIHHSSALISYYADLYVPVESCCVLEFGDISTEYSPETFKNALRRFDANTVARVEHGCNNGDFIKFFGQVVDEIKNNMPSVIPRSKYNTYIMLKTALIIYNEWYTPLFCPDLENYIIEWLCSQEQDSQPLYDVICSDFGLHFNKKLADGYYRFTLKDEVTQFDKGTHTIVIDRGKRRVCVETADTYAIAKDEMHSVDNPEIVPAALYSNGYLPPNPKEEKSVRIAAITSDGIPYPLYVHAISYKLLTQENKQRFELLDKEANLFTYDEMPREGFLPLIKTVDGRFAGKMLRYASEESHIYFGTGKTGSGKSWAIAQLICMLFMLGQLVVVFDVSGSYTKKKLLKMLPAEVVEKLFRFINVGLVKDPVPVDLGSLRGCETLPDKKRAIYSVLRGATGPLDKVTSRKLKGFLSDYLKDKEDSISLNYLCSELEQAERFGAEIADCVQSVLDDIKEIGFEKQTWDNLFSQERKIIVINLGNEVGDSTHQLLDMLTGSLFSWQMSHDTGFLSIAIDELIDQDFSKGSPLSTIVKQGRKFHTALIGATQDYYNQGSSHLDVMKQANIKSFCRPGKSEDRVAQKLGYRDAIDAGFNKFKPGDTIIEFDGYNKETGENEALTMKGRVVNFIETPHYEKFKEEYSKPKYPPGYYGNVL